MYKNVQIPSIKILIKTAHSFMSSYNIAHLQFVQFLKPNMFSSNLLYKYEGERKREALRVQKNRKSLAKIYYLFIRIAITTL